MTIRLPAFEPPSTVLSASRSSEASDHTDLGGACRVLIVDDNEDAARTLAMLVKDLGGQSQIANDGPSALHSLAEFQPEIVLLDIGMPGMDGYETCRRMRQAAGDSGLILVALTGWGQEDDRQRALDAGFDLHLTKPADPIAVQQLLADIDRARALGQTRPA